MRNLLSAAIAIAGVIGLTVAAVNPALAGGPRVRLEARLSSAVTAASGKARYESERGRQRFSVQIEDAAPNATHSVVVDGAIVGSIMTNGLGRGELNFDTNFEPGVDDPATRFPDNFPVVGPGSMVVIAGGGDTLTGAMRPR